MDTYRVAVPKLNKRRFPVEDMSEKSNVVEIMLGGAAFDAELATTNKLGDWYRDTSGYYYWGGGLEKERTATGITAVADWGLSSINIPSVWAQFGETGQGAKVAVLDTGYDTNNSDLSKAVTAGKVMFRSAEGAEVLIHDKGGHGSHCASLIGGRNRLAVTGCAPASELYIGKVSSKGALSWESLIKGIAWAIEMSVDIISISFGGDVENEELKKIVAKAVKEHNILVVAAIGDKKEHGANLPCYPALFDDCLAVGATDSQGKLAPVNILHEKTLINAPGDKIKGYGLDGALVTHNGTSQAAAIVAGTAALIVSRLKKKKVDYNVALLKQMIVTGATPVKDEPLQKIINPLAIFTKIG
ncbi:MAG TPA: S8 family serine peptidase [Chitinophaga sp.]